MPRDAGQHVVAYASWSERFDHDEARVLPPQAVQLLQRKEPARLIEATGRLIVGVRPARAQRLHLKQRDAVSPKVSLGSVQQRRVAAPSCPRTTRISLTSSRFTPAFPIRALEHVSIVGRNHRYVDRAHAVVRMTASSELRAVPLEEYQR